MPEKEPGRMESYVKGKNDVSDSTRKGKVQSGNPSFDDLKVPTKTSASNTHHSRTKSQHANQAAPVKSEPRPPNVDQHGRRDSTEQRRFYDTDASSVGKTSTAASAQGSNRVATQTQQQRQVASGRHNEQQPPSSSGSDGSGSTESEDLPENPVHGVTGVALTTKQQSLMQEVEAGKKKHADGKNLPYIAGDSYPPTTSGRLSETNVAQLNDTYSKEDERLQAGRMSALPTRESSHRQQFGVNSTRHHVQAKQPREPAHLDQRHVASGFLARQDEPNKAPLEQQVTTGFAFGKPPNQKLSARPPPQQPRQHNAASSTTPNVSSSNNTAQRASVPSAEETSDRLVAKQRKPETAKQIPGFPQQPLGPKPQDNQQASSIVQQPVVEAAPDYEQLSDAEANVQNGFGSQINIQGQDEEPETQVDYEAPGLFGMDYQELREQSFDVDPNAKDFKLPLEQLADDLPTKLTTVGALQPRDQYDFLASLPLEDWEQAGEWFLDRFSNVMTKLKEARQEKRKAARLFEDEVDKRYKAVGQKRKQIEGSLSEMKESGGKVLQGTPKKPKTK